MNGKQKKIAEERVRKLKFYLLWISSNREKVDPQVAPAAKDFLQMEIAQTEREMKNTFRQGKALGLRNRLRILFVAILSQKSTLGK